MITYGTFAIEEVLPFIGPFEREYYAGGRIFIVKMGSQRYEVFRRSRECANCGLIGDRFLLQSSETHKLWYDHEQRISYPRPLFRAHFNLFGVSRRGKLIMLTKDHIQPLSKGGVSMIVNYQTMCAPCNNIKKRDRWPMSEPKT
jgi:5-methylcytosine-specific restriction endonuclease McrA